MTQVIERKCVPDDLLPDPKLLETAQVFANEVIKLPSILGVALVHNGNADSDAHVYVYHVTLSNKKRIELMDEVDDIFAAHCFDCDGKVFRASFASLALLRIMKQRNRPEFAGKKIAVLAAKK